MGFSEDTPLELGIHGFEAANTVPEERDLGS